MGAQVRQRKRKGWRKTKDWPAKIPVLLVAFVFGFIDDALHWGPAPVVAVIAMMLPVLGFRDFWDETKFWITVALLSALQVPIGIAVSPLMQQFKFPFVFMFGIFDCVLVALAISWACARRDRNGS